MTIPAPMTNADFITWRDHGQRGMSSNAIADTLTGATAKTRLPAPADPADFRRCELLLRAVPAAREHMHLMASKGPDWEALVAEWDDLVRMAEAEAPDIWSPNTRGVARNLYARMQEIHENSYRTAEVAQRV